MAEPIRSPIVVPLLAASQSWTMAAQNRLSTYLIRRIRPEVYAPVGGTLYVEESDDEAFASSTTLATITVTANTTPATAWVTVSKKWYRLRYANGAAAQTSRMDLWIEKDDRDIQDVEVSGSGVANDAPDSENPVKIGYVAESTIPAAVADGDRVNAAGTLYGAAFVNPVTSAGAQVTGATGSAVPAGAVQIAVSDASNLLSIPVVVTPADAQTNSLNALIALARLEGFNGTTWDRWRNNTEASPVTSAARTTSSNSADITVYNGAMLAAFLDVTAASGTTPTLDVTVKVKDPTSGKYFTVGTFTQATGVTNQALFIGAGGDTEFITRTYRIEWVIAGTTPSFTFSVGAAASVA